MKKLSISTLAVLIMVSCDFSPATSPSPSRPSYTILTAASNPPEHSTVKIGDYVSVSLVVNYDLTGGVNGSSPVYAALLCHMYARVPGTFNAGLAHPADRYGATLPLQATGKTLTFEGNLGDNFCYDVPANDVIDYVTLTFYQVTNRQDHVSLDTSRPSAHLNWKIEK